MLGSTDLYLAFRKADPGGECASAQATTLFAVAMNNALRAAPRIESNSAAIATGKDNNCH